MTDKTREALARGEKAKRVLENPIINKWWDDVNTVLDFQMRQCPYTDQKRKDELHALIIAVSKMKKDFKRYVLAGENAKTKLAKESLRNRVKRLTA